MPIVLSKKAPPKAPVAMPGAEMSLEDLGRAVCPKCKKELEWEADADAIGRELGAVHPACGLVFVGVNMTWRVSVMDKYKNELGVLPSGQLGFLKPKDTAPKPRTPRYRMNNDLKGVDGNGFLMVDEPAPVRGRGRAEDPEDPPAEDEPEDDTETVAGEPGEIAEPDFPTED